MANSTKMALDVVVNGLTAEQAVNKAKARLATINTKAFNCSVLMGYTAGLAIPAFNGKGKAVIDGKKSKQWIADRIGCSRTRVSRLVSALQAVIEGGDFALFASGELSFEYDKIILFYGNKEEFALKGITLVADALKRSYSELEGLIKAENADADGDGDGNDDADADGDETADTDMVVFTYNGVRYEVATEVVYNALMSANVIK